MNGLLGIPQVKSLVLKSTGECPILEHLRSYYRTSSNEATFRVTPLKKLLYALEEKRVQDLNTEIKAHNELHPDPKKQRKIQPISEDRIYTHGKF